jgi:uncharacterized protein YrrD
MLRKAHDLIGFTIAATDGDIGHVDDFYFDAESWQVRYLVVDTGPWIFGRKVLITPEVIEQPLWEEEHLPLRLSKEQIENSPETDFDKPVSRQHEIDIHTHYGWTPYWMPFPVYMGAPGIAPIGATAPATVVPATDAAPNRSYAEEVQHTLEEAHQQGDPHLHSIQEVTGYYIQAQDGDIGHVEDFFLDEADWKIRYLLVDTQNWWPGKQVLIAPDWTDHISWQESKLFVTVTREQVKQSPEYDPAPPLHRDYEASLYRYYGYPGYWL